MKKLTPQSTAKAIAKAMEERCEVKRTGKNTYEVVCPKKHQHTVTFEWRGTELWAECAPCGSSWGPHVCKHMVCAAALFIGAAKMRRFVATRQEAA